MKVGFQKILRNHRVKKILPAVGHDDRTDAHDYHRHGHGGTGNVALIIL